MIARRRALAAAGLVLALGAGCSVESTFRREDEAPTQAGLRVIAVPETATVYVGDRFAGTAAVLAERPEPLRPGVHFVTVRAPGHFPHDLRLDLPPGVTTVRITLRPVPP